MIDTIHTLKWYNPHYDSDAPDRNDAAEITRDDIFQSAGQATFDCVYSVKLGPQYQYDTVALSLFCLEDRKRVIWDFMFTFGPSWENNVTF